MIPAGHELLGRVVADSRDRPAWQGHRHGRIGGSDAAGLAKIESVPSYVRSKLSSDFGGNAYTQHGNNREARMLRAYRLQQNTLMFRSATNPRHVSTPDGILVAADGHIIIAECKTTNKPLTKIPPGYRRQVLWNMYVTGATECLFIWEPHEGFVAIDCEPESTLVRLTDYEPDELPRLIEIADAVIDGVLAAERFRQELDR